MGLSLEPAREFQRSETAGRSGPDIDRPPGLPLTNGRDMIQRQ